MRNKDRSTNYLLHTTYSSGQSMIETIVAIFILTAALSAGVGLAIYALSNAKVSLDEIVATNLAREGVDTIRMMRDSNWLAGDANLAACADLGGKLCYPGAYVGPTYNIVNSGACTDCKRRIIFDTTSSAWSLDDNTNFNMYLQANGTYSHTVNGVSNYARTVNLSLNFNAPYTGLNPELIVKSVVAWRGKNCNTSSWGGQNQQDPTLAPSACKVIVEEHLTNWKDYQ